MTDRPVKMQDVSDSEVVLKKHMMAAAQQEQSVVIFHTINPIQTLCSTQLTPHQSSAPLVQWSSTFRKQCLANTSRVW
jgi:hypothetical protein